MATITSAAPVEARESLQDAYDRIPGTIVFDSRAAMKGYALNKMCYSFNSRENREAYRRNEDAYCEAFQLNAQQRLALKHRNVAELLEAGGNMYYLAKWAGIFGMTVQQLGAQQRGITEDAFKEMLLRSGD
jgi:protocatechuate 4,5-dioxygenase alpha chain